MRYTSTRRAEKKKKKKKHHIQSRRHDERLLVVREADAGLLERARAQRKGTIVSRS